MLEYCDRGTMRDALSAQAFTLEDGSLNYAAVLDTAADIARAMMHLHKQQVRRRPPLALRPVRAPFVTLRARSCSSDGLQTGRTPSCPLCQIIHSDLKARNVLLKTDGRSGRGVVAKVGDFGLAVRIDPHATHVSEYRGTMSA